MTNLQTSLIVEAYLDRASLRGLLANVSQNRRLVDVLGNQDKSFDLESAEVRLAGSSEVYRFKSVAVKKTDVFYAIPRETTEQIRARAMYRTGMTRQSATAMEVGILLKTCHIAGTALLPPAVGRGKVDTASFPSFFALTGAVITQADGTRTEEAVVIINREAVIAIGRPDEA
jgi:hypothetical protein